MAVDITPSPRILIILGTVDIKPWQCIAELVDNALDGYLNAPKSWKNKYGSEMKIEIHLPSKEELEQGTGEVVVKDTGPGMTEEKLNDAVRAGWSGNDGYDRLGLFGVGFNIATAKLGKKARISTARKDDEDRYWISIDPNAMHEHWKENPQGAWLAPDGMEPKESGFLDQGTIVRITQLDSEQCSELLKDARSPVNLRKRLGRIYAPLMEEHNIKIKIFSKASRSTSGLPISKWRHCIWDQKRTTKFKGQEMRTPEYIHAKQEIHKVLPSQYYCESCWKWFKVGEEPKECSEDSGGCGSTKNIKKRRREIKGWLGVQRAFFGAAHKPQNHFGIDLVRNGRVLREISKAFFTVEEPDGTPRVDYPVEGNYCGRIVGSLDISFCPTDPRKNGFDERDQNWLDVVKSIQGNGLRPKKTTDSGLEYIPTELSMMVRAFGPDKIDASKVPGFNTLIAGKVKMSKGKPVLDNNELPTLGADFSKHREYVTEKFWKEIDPEFESDEKWWEDIEWAEEFDAEDWLDDWKKEQGESDDDDEDKCKHDEDPKKCKRCNSGNCQHRVPKKSCRICTPIIIENSWRLDESLSKTYSIDLKGATFDFVVEAYSDEGKVRTKDAPLKLINKRKREYIAIYQKGHPMFTSFKESPADYLMMNLAWLASKLNSLNTYPETYVYLKENYCEEQKVDFVNVKASTNNLVSALKDYILEWQLDGTASSTALIEHVKSHLARTEHKGEGAAKDELEDGTFVQRLSGRLLFDEIIINRVSELLDGNFFTSEIKRITNASQRKNILREYETYLSLVCNIDDIEKPDYNSLLTVQSAVIWLENRRA